MSVGCPWERCGAVGVTHQRSSWPEMALSRSPYLRAGLAPPLGVGAASPMCSREDLGFKMLLQIGKSSQSSHWVIFPAAGAATSSAEDGVGQGPFCARKASGQVLQLPLIQPSFAVHLHSFSTFFFICVPCREQAALEEALH